jgi:membrane-associated phospholipid phosphatase
MLNKITCINENNKLMKCLDFIKKYYPISIGSFFLILAILNCFFHFVLIQYTGYILLFSFTSFTAMSDIRKDVNKAAFFKLALPYILFILTILVFGNNIWHYVLNWEMSRNITFNLNSLFTSIPFNDASFARIFKPAWLTTYMNVVYTNGFVLCVLVPFYRAALSIDFKKMLRYTLSAHLFQVLIFTPFYVTFYIQNVWFVYGHADPLARNMSYAEAAQSTLNGFPSMHTSIAFAMFLLVLRERNTIFKWVWGFFCLSVIYSTMYLEIHWVIDVIAGLIFGYLVVKLVDFVLAKTKVVFPSRFSIKLHKAQETFL